LKLLEKYDIKRSNYEEEEPYMKKAMDHVLANLRNRNWAVAALNAMALMVIIQNMNAGCGWIDHQPEIPEEARSFRKF
jgi:cyclic lactone autoinducer peptide